MALFNRVAAVYVDDTNTRTEIKNVRITFSCEKTVTSTKNKASISIYNLKKATRDLIEKDDIQITLLAGYEDESGEEILFRGDVTYVRHRIATPDIITEIEIKDGHIALRESRLSESFKPGTTIDKIVSKLGNSLGVPVKEISSNLKESFSNGFSVVGPVKDSLDKILDKMDLEWHIIDGELEILDKHQPNTETAIVISSGSGLLSSPEPVITDSTALKGAKDSKKKLNVKSLLLPKLNPGRKIVLESINYEGIYRIETVNHSGDTHGGDWTSVCEVHEI